MSTIASLNYNKSEKVMEVVFGYDTEKVYKVEKFPATKAKAWESAESKGKFWHSEVKGKFAVSAPEFIQ